jgi:hypothetical protein
MSHILEGKHAKRKQQLEAAGKGGDAVELSSAEVEAVCMENISISVTPEKHLLVQLHTGKVKVRTIGNCTIFRHNIHSNFYISVNIWRVILGNFLNYRTTEP